MPGENWEGQTTCGAPCTGTLSQLPRRGAAEPTYNLLGRYEALAPRTVGGGWRAFKLIEAPTPNTALSHRQRLPRMLRLYGGMQPAPGSENAFNLGPQRVAGVDDVAQDPIHRVFVEDAEVAVAEEVQFE